MEPSDSRPDDGDQLPTRPLPPGQRWVERLRPNHYGRVPRVDLDTWSLTIGGDTVDGAQTILRWDDIERLGHVTLSADHHCVDRRSVAGVDWGGIPCAAVLELAAPAAAATHVLAYAAYGYSSSVTVADLRHPDALLATHVNGRPLRPEQGWPLRLVLPHLYGWKGPKWLMTLEYSAVPRRGFWEERGYHLTGDVWREERYAHEE